MKIITLLFFSTFTLALHADVNHYVTLNVKNEPLVDVFSAVTAQTNLRFSYPADLINPNKRVSINVNRMLVEEMLPLILPSDVDCKLRKTHIILHVSSAVNRPTELPIEKKTVLQKEETQVIMPRDTFFLEKIQVTNNGIPIDNCHNDIIKKNEEDMKRQLASICIATAIASVNVTAAEPNTVSAQTEIETHENGFTHEIKERPLQLSFVYPLGTDGVYSSQNTYNFSFNCIFGYTGQVNGVEIGGIVNKNRYGINGIQMAGISNLSGTDSRGNESGSGIQLAGISNHSKGTMNMQISGIVNTVKQTSNIQVGGIANYSAASNVQVSGIVNYSDTSDIQIAGIHNGARQSPLQVSGISNSANRSAIQITGIANVSKSSDLQIAGILNVTKQGRLQIGLVNVRDTADGVSIGLVNIVKRGGLMELEVAAGELLHTTVSFRSGTNALYTMLSIGANYIDGFWGVGAGFGTNLRFTERIGLNLEVQEYTFYGKNFYNSYSGNEQLIQLRPTFNYRFAKHFKLFVGPTVNLLFKYNSGFTFPYSSFAPVYNPIITAPYSIYTYQRGAFRWDNWIGFTAGVRF